MLDIRGAVHFNLQPSVGSSLLLLVASRAPPTLGVSTLCSLAGQKKKARSTHAITFCCHCWFLDEVSLYLAQGVSCYYGGQATSAR